MKTPVVLRRAVPGESFKKRFTYFIEIAGMGESSVGVTVDSRLLLTQVHPGGYLAVYPKTGSKKPTFEDMVFVANCLAFDHDAPTFIVRPGLRGPVPIRSIGTRRQSVQSQDYYHSVSQAYQALADLRLGDYMFYLRWEPTETRTFDLAYGRRYLPIVDELALYAHADPRARAKMLTSDVEGVDVPEHGTHPDMTTQARARCALQVPLLQFLHARLLDEGDLTRGISLTLSPSALNAVEAVHAGTLAAVLEVTAYLVLVGQLTGTEEAVTHAFFASYVAPIPPDAVLESTGALVRRGRSIAFVTVEMRAGDEIVAVANVSKSIRGS